MQRNTFVFGIGGTGARVIRSLTMLLASGVELKDTGKVIPIIIDVDAKNADTTRALKALETYLDIRKNGYGDRENINGFFKSDLNTLSSIEAEKESKVEDSFQLQFENIGTSFIDYIDPKQELRDDITMDLLRALYDDTEASHPDFHNTELNLRLDYGFKGNPNIGCVVFNNLSNTSGFKFVLKSIRENDRVFIVSSIFGGTGSSGFPQLVRLLQEEETVRKVPFGALTVMPYFKVDPRNTKSAINSNNFNAKTEAAISYYSKYLKGKINCFYSLWDNPTKVYENNEGGVEQKNNAHLIEFLGATSIIDFINKPSQEIKPKERTEYYDFGIQKPENVIDISHFYKKTQSEIMQPLTLLTFALKLHTESIPLLSGEAFYKELELASSSTNPLYKSMTTFFVDHYRPWLLEMINNERQFQPFNLDADFNSLVRGQTIKVSKTLGITLDAGISTKFLKEKLGIEEDKLKKEVAAKEQRYLRLLNVIAMNCAQKLPNGSAYSPTA